MIGGFLSYGMYTKIRHMPRLERREEYKYHELAKSINLSDACI